MSNGINIRQFRAIVLAIQVGREIVRDMPEVVELFYSGRTYPEIEREKQISDRYTDGSRRITPRIATVALSHAMKGHDGRYEEEAYEGLIKDEKILEIMRTRHRADNCRKTNDLLHKLEAEGKIKIDTKKRKGFGKEGAKARGFTPWIERRVEDNVTYLGERDLLARYFNLESHTYGPGNHQGQPNLGMITDSINNDCHDGRPVRTKHAVRLAAIELRREGRIRRYKN